MLRIVVLCLFCVFANAHSLKVFAKEENGVVNLKSFFYGNSPCKECEVSLIKNGEIIQTLKTDENGKASFKVIADEFEIQVDGGLGHGKSINFKAQKNENEKENLQENSQNLEKKSKTKAENSTNLNENSTQNENAVSKENFTQNSANSLKENSSPNLAISDDLQDDEAGESEILKFALSFLIIFVFFGVLYLVKKR